ncbi:MAG: toll/interleukin-1 receptor domain-containing protein [Chloroflexota bacterium]
MARIFVSYSRADRQFIDQFIPLIRRVYGNDSVWFDDDIHGGVVWWQMILNEVGKCDLFVYLVSNESLESPYCQAELREALRLNKAILPVIVRRLKPPYPGNIADDLAPMLRKTQYVG